MTYQGRDKFRTTFGGVLSVCVIMFLLSLFVINFSDLISKSKTEVKKNTLVTNSNAYTPPEDISAMGFQFAFKLSDLYNVIDINDPYYGSLVLQDFLVTNIHN